MKQNAFIVLATANALLIAGLAGCEGREPPKEEVRSVDWYVKYESAKLIECQSRPGILDATPNCVNASRAENAAKARTVWATEEEGVRTVPPTPVVP